MKPGNITPVIILGLLAIASRIPMLLSPDLILDGDECVVAMMAKNLYHGKEIPLFFYGQNYGFAFVEVLAILPFYLILGFGTYAVKFAMLSLWVTGVVFFYRALKEASTPGNKWLPFFISLLLLAQPGWAVFSMKAYGGYLTASLFSNFLLFILFRNENDFRSGRNIILSLFFAIIFQSQVLWAVVVAPFIAWHWWRHRSWKNAVFLTFPFLLLTLIFSLYRSGLSKFNIAARYNPLETPWRQLSRIPEFIFTGMHGRHELWQSGPVSGPLGAFAIAMTVLVFLLLIIAAVDAVRKRSLTDPFVLSGMIIGCCLAYTTLTWFIQGKYVLPLIAATLFSLFLFLNSRRTSPWLYIAISFFSLLGLYNILRFDIFHWPKTDPVMLDETIRYLEDHDVHHVYSTQGMLAWQLIYYSDEKVIARPYKFPGRYAAYGKAVDSVFRAGGNTAVVGYADTTMNEYEYPDGHHIGNLFIYLNAPEERLRKRFEFEEGDIFTPF